MPPVPGTRGGEVMGRACYLLAHTLVSSMACWVPLHGTSAPPVTEPNESRRSRIGDAAMTERRREQRTRRKARRRKRRYR